MNISPLLKKLEELKVDCMYGKKIHYNAADRKDFYYKWIFIIPIIVVNIVLSSTLFSMIKTEFPVYLGYIAASISLINAILIGLLRHFRFDEQVSMHRKIAQRYLDLAKRVTRKISYFEANEKVSMEEVNSFLDEAGKENHQINIQSDELAICKKDHKKAQKSFESGEESYTDKELNR